MQKAVSVCGSNTTRKPLLCVFQWTSHDALRTAVPDDDVLVVRQPHALHEVVTKFRPYQSWLATRPGERDER